MNGAARTGPGAPRSGPGCWSPEREADRRRLTHVPFGGGRRPCLGEGFAGMEGGLVPATPAAVWRLQQGPGHGAAGLPPVARRLEPACISRADGLREGR
ncbi:MAG: cytochrome P450 [Gemmatimonadetes bacterium]|nr:cytochrome P450 [Gemmatimonadota bacterium]